MHAKKKKYLRTSRNTNYNDIYLPTNSRSSENIVLLEVIHVVLEVGWQIVEHVKQGLNVH